MICIFLCVTCTIKGQQPDWLATATDLYGKEQYFEASVFCERVLYESNEEQPVLQAIWLKVQCYKQLHEFTKAAAFMAQVQTRARTDSMQRVLYNEMGTCYYLAGDFENAIAVADRASVLFAGSSNWLTLLKILSLNELNRWQEAAVLYKQQGALPGDSLPDYYATLPRQKSEKKAGWLATFIPGAGHFYAGKPWEGVASIALQAGGLYYGISSWIHKYYISAWLVGGGLAGTFHMGGISRAQTLVQQYNKRKAADFNNKVRETLLARW